MSTRIAWPSKLLGIEVPVRAQLHPCDVLGNRAFAGIT